MAQRIPDPEEIIGLALKLKEAKDHLALLQVQWVSYFTRADEDVSVTSQESNRGTLQNRIVSLLEDNPNTTYTTFSVVTNLGANPNSVGPILSRLVAERKIARVGHGEYGALRPLSGPIHPSESYSLSDDQEEASDAA